MPSTLAPMRPFRSETKFYSGIARTPLRPARSDAIDASTELPIGESTPVPVTTTRARGPRLTVRS